MAVSIWWIRRDLRLRNNPALQHALRDGQAVLPVFVLDPHLLTKPAENRQGFLFEGLRALDADLRQRGSRLIVRRGEPLDVLTRLMQEAGAQQIWAEEDYSPYARERDEAVGRALPLNLVLGCTMHHPAAVLKPDGTPYRVFTAFRRAWLSLPPPGITSINLPERFPSILDIQSDPIPEGKAPAAFPASEMEAQRRLEAFLDTSIYQYAEGRDRLDWEGTSALSPYLRFGMLPAAQAVLAARNVADQPGLDPQERDSCQTWINELIWREFYNGILYHFPQVLKMAFNPSMRFIQWRDSESDLQAWQAGLTGYPVVDACLRQLRGLGWMHNRGRMISASFLVKDLLLNWQWGEAWFMRQLVDGDPAVNNGGWQWTAGVGTDAAPYFRLFNPISQGEKHDPEGRFIRRWVPELANVPNQYIHQPWLMPLELQRSCGCRIGSHYPPPIVDRAVVRERVLAAYQASMMQYKASQK